MALKFKELKIGDPIYFVMLQSSCEDEMACKIQQGTLVKIDVEAKRMFYDGKVSTVNKYEYWVDEGKGYTQRLTIFDSEWHPGATTLEDNFYWTGNYRYCTDSYPLKQVINEYVNKELAMLERKLAKVKENIDALKSKLI